jgi:hypothetical protein
VAINIPIISTFQKQGIQDAIKQFKALETRAQKFQFIMAKATSPAGLTAMAGAATTAAYAIFNMANAAADDQKSQAILATALKNTTGATDAQVASVEELISKMQMAAGISDTELRTGFQNLARATGDVTKAQDLLTLATDISVGTGKSLETVTLGLSKAYQGNLGSLKRLGIPLDENIVKTKDFDAATRVLSDTFGGSAANAADTYAGKMAITQQKIEEAKETIGALFIPVIEQLTDVLGPAADGVATLADAFSSLKAKAEDANGVLGKTFDLLNPLAFFNLGKIASGGRDLTDTFEEMYNPTNGLNEAIDSLAGMLPKLDTGFTKVGRSITSEVETPLEKFLKNLARVKEELTDTVKGLFDLGAAYRDSKNFPDFMKNVKSMVGQIKNYGKNLLKLQGMGLGPLAIQGIMQMDLASGSQFAEDLLAQSNALRDIRTLNQAYTAVGAVAGQVGAGLATGQETGQVTQYITISNPNPQEVVNKLRQYQRVNGAIPIRVTGVA